LNPAFRRNRSFGSARLCALLLALVTSAMTAAQQPAELEPPALARALLHEAPAQFESTLAASPVPRNEERRRFLRAFSLAVAGERDQARALAVGLAAERGLAAHERAALARALAGPGPSASAVPASHTVSVETPLARALDMALLARELREQPAGAAPVASARNLSALLLAEVDAPWPAERAALERWSSALAQVQQAYRWNPAGGWPGIETEVRAGDSLTTVRARAVKENPQWKLCTGLIARSNRLGEVIHPGQRLRIPIEAASTLVDLDARWLFFKLGEEVVAAWPVCIGRPGNDTAPGQYTVGELTKDPMWFPEGQQPVPFGDPRNPLGTRWIGWEPEPGGKRGLGYHGTNEPGTIGTAASDGCVRMRNEDVEELYLILPRGTRIVVR